MTADTLDRDRLAKLLGMMGSTHDGEVVAAARQVERLRADAGLTWPEILVPRLPPPAGGQNVRTVADAIDFVIEHEVVLTDWERGFVRDLRRLKYPLSPKQIGILERLVEKVHRAEARAAWFETFWRYYPSRKPHDNPKKPARLKFEAAVKRGVDPTMIVRGAENFVVYAAAHISGPRFIKTAEVWLNKECWSDYQQPPEPEPLRAGMI